MIVRKQGDWLAARVGDEILMMSAGQGLYLGLNAVGARVWELIDAPGDAFSNAPSIELSTAEAICARLLDEFAVMPDTCRVEVDAFLAQLASHRAIALEPAAGA